MCLSLVASTALICCSAVALTQDQSQSSRFDEHLHSSSGAARGGRPVCLFTIGNCLWLYLDLMKLLTVAVQQKAEVEGSIQHKTDRGQVEASCVRLMQPC